MGILCPLFSLYARQAPTHSITGVVLTASNASPLPGATLHIRNTTNGTLTDATGHFKLNNVENDAILTASSIGYEVAEIKIGEKTILKIRLKEAVNSLDETVIMAYGVTTKRLNTGSISKITSKEISRQPVANPLAALEGRVPGMIVTQSNGVPGSAFKIEIRGRSSIDQGSDPLFIVDGVPLAAGNNPVSSIISSAGYSGNGEGVSPFNSIPPSSIESIEVLKDADATAIYGSKGANGVVLITTKKGKAGTTQFDVNVYSGISKVTRTMNMLNTRQYVAMRKEAFENDDVMPDNTNAYDILLWDTTRYTDFRKLLIGHTAHTTNVQTSISGGTTNTQFRIAADHHHETTVFPGSFSDNRNAVHLNLNHTAKDKKFNLSFSGNYSVDKNKIPRIDFTSFLNAVPNLPSLIDSSGRLVWQDKNIPITDNPLSTMYQTYGVMTDNLLANVRLNYLLAKGLMVKANLGYNSMQVRELFINPKIAQDPSLNPSSSSQFSNTLFKSMIAEPQIEYNTYLGRGKLDVLIGGTWQQEMQEGTYTSAKGFSNENLLRDISAATQVKTSNSYSQYKYAAFFGRLNYNWNDRYIINVTGRRDGSSRFGPGRQFSNFGSAGAAWIFSNERFFPKRNKWISFGKLRASYGSSGNDKIGNYKYLDTWNAVRYAYQGTGGFSPSSLFNPDYGWEINRKLEAGIELGAFNNRILLTTVLYRNRSSNQLINYKLPSQTGFPAINRNFPAIIENKGWEIEISTINAQASNFTWSSYLTLTIPKNRLIEFEGIETSSYSNLVVGQPLSVYGGFRLAGVDTETGVWRFTATDGKPVASPDYPEDFIQNLGNRDPEFYCGINNILTYKGWELDFFFAGRKQTGYNYLYQNGNNIPGTMVNQPVIVLDRWQKPGENASVQKFTTTASSPAYSAAKTVDSYLVDAEITDASFIRLKTLSFSYRFPEIKISKIYIDNCRVYLQAQNLITVTGYKGADPESQNLLTLPPLKTLTAGIQISL